MKRKKKNLLNKEFKNIEGFARKHVILMKIGLYLIILSLIYSHFYYEIQYATSSLIFDCDIWPRLIAENNSTNNNLTSLGVAGYYSADTGNLTMLIPKEDKNYQIGLNHEKCHQKQASEGKLYNCNFRIGVFINELECYIKTGVPT